MVGEETFSFYGDLNACFEGSSYLDLGFTNGGSMAIDKSCKVRKMFKTVGAVALMPKRSEIWTDVRIFHI